MKHMSSRPLEALVLLLLLLLFSLHYSAAAARLLAPLVHKEDHGLMQVDHQEKMDNELSEIMGVEGCEDGNEECLQRRLLHDAHLDYIYTQRRHNP